MHIRYAMPSFTPTSITTTITVFISCIINYHGCVFMCIYIERDIHVCVYP